MGEFGGQLERDEFYKQAIQPDFPNFMAFELSVNEELRKPQTSFSEEGLKNMVEQMQTFILARILGQWHKTGKPPYELRALVDLNFGETPVDPIEEGPWPYWTLVDRGKRPLEGSHRPSTRQEP